MMPFSMKQQQQKQQQVHFFSTQSNNMTFVFEARELPFDTVTDDYASRIDGLVQKHDLTHLPLWDRCLLAAVLPVVQERRQAVAAAAAAALAGPSRDAPDALNKIAHFSEPEVNSAAQADLTMPSSSSAITTSPSTNSTTTATTTNSTTRPTAAHASVSSDVSAAALPDIEVALAIVRQLDELEVVYDSILSTRQAQQPQHEDDEADRPPVFTAPSPRQPQKTSEEILMEQLLQERFSDTAPYLPESDDDNDGDNDDGEAVVDVAMCFTAKGESLGIGSAAVFGGHGYHP